MVGRISSSTDSWQASSLLLLSLGSHSSEPPSKTGTTKLPVRCRSETSVGDALRTTWVYSTGRRGSLVSLYGQHSNRGRGWTGHSGVRPPDGLCRSRWCSCVWDHPERDPRLLRGMGHRGAATLGTAPTGDSMSTLPSATTAAVLAIITAACVTDLRSRRVPNTLTFAGTLAAFLFHLVTGGVGGFLASAGGCVVGLMIFLPLFALHGMGAGDVKLLATLGAWLGASAALWIALYAAVAGGILALIVGVAHGYLRSAFSNLWVLMAFWRAAGLRPHPQVTLAASAGPRLPYALAIAIGALVTVWRH